MYFHLSHLKGKQDYGHQAVDVMLFCNGIVLNYAIVMHDKSKSKVKIVQEIVGELSIPPVISYFLCDSWYTYGDIMGVLLKMLLYHWCTEDEPGALPLRHKAENRRVCPPSAEDRCSCQPRDRWQPGYYVYRYEGKLNGIENAVVLIRYPQNAFHVPKALRAFISTDASLDTREILDRYVERWPIEVFVRQSKDRLAFDRYQIRSSKGIRRYWLLTSLTHLVACTGCGEAMSFEDGYAYIYSHIQKERHRFIYQYGARPRLFEEVLALMA